MLTGKGSMITNDELFEFICRSLNAAKTEPETGISPRLLLPTRSRRFVEALAAEFRTVFKTEDDYGVFSKHHPEHRGYVKLNELSYDVHVCKIGLNPNLREMPERL